MAQPVSQVGNTGFSCPTAVSVTTTPAALPSQPCDSVIVQNDPGSAAAILVGDSTRQLFSLAAGSNVKLDVANTALIYLKTGSSTATANCLILSAQT